ncbi:MAG: DNA polymerase beta superfamily protein [Eubacteriales bacterium]
MACRRILDKKTPPMLFATLMDACLEEEIRLEIEKLLDIKMNNPEIAKGKKIHELNQYIEKNMEICEKKIHALPLETEHGWHEFNALFISLFD